MANLCEDPDFVDQLAEQHIAEDNEKREKLEILIHDIGIHFNNPQARILRQIVNLLN